MGSGGHRYTKTSRNTTLPAPSVPEKKSSHHPPSSILQPLSIPKRPWSHLFIDFATGLPVSKGMTTIFTIVACFSKSCHLIPLRKPPTAFRPLYFWSSMFFDFTEFPRRSSLTAAHSSHPRYGNNSVLLLFWSGSKCHTLIWLLPLV